MDEPQTCFSSLALTIANSCLKFFGVFLANASDSQLEHIFETLSRCSGEPAPEDGRLGRLGGSVVERLPLAQGVLGLSPGTKSRIALAAWSLLLPLPVCLPLSVSHE